MNKSSRCQQGTLHEINDTAGEGPSASAASVSVGTEHAPALDHPSIMIPVIAIQVSMQDEHAGPAAMAASFQFNGLSNLRQFRLLDKTPGTHMTTCRTSKCFILPKSWCMTSMSDTKCI